MKQITPKVMLAIVPQKAKRNSLLWAMSCFVVVASIFPNKIGFIRYIINDSRWIASKASQHDRIYQILAFINKKQINMCKLLVDNQLFKGIMH